MSGKGNIAFLHAAPCEVCGEDVARRVVEGVWLCEACAEQLAAAPAPLQTHADKDSARFGAPLEESVERLLGGKP